MVEPESVPVQMSRKPENPKQFKLFMRPQELMDTIRYSVDDHMSPVYRTGTRDEVMDELWKFKRGELRSQPYSGMVRSIEQHGVLRPVTIEVHGKQPLTMGQGHHRVAASKRVEEKTGRQVYIPVVYHDNLHHSENTELYPVQPAEAEYRSKVKDWHYRNLPV